MKICLLLSLFLGMLVFQAKAATTPVQPVPEPSISLQKLNAKSFRELTGRKMTLKEKMALWVLKRKLRKAGDGDTFTEKQQKQATLSMIFGLTGLAFIFIPYAILLSIPLAIAAIILGFKSLKGNSNTKGIIGVVAGFTIPLFLIIALIVILSTPFF